MFKSCHDSLKLRVDLENLGSYIPLYPLLSLFYGRVYRVFRIKCVKLQGPTLWITASKKPCTNRRRNINRYIAISILTYVHGSNQKYFIVICIQIYALCRKASQKTIHYVSTCILQHYLTKQPFSLPLTAYKITY